MSATLDYAVRTLTMPVSAVRCCDWKKTASFSPQFEQCFWTRGN
jgi:hypothetical protein